MKQVLIVISFFLVSGCSSLGERPAWPAGAYPRGFFITTFQKDEQAQQYQTQEEYLSWIARFYNGNHIIPGWLGLTGQVLEKVDGPERAETRERLYRLGGLISSEWAKDNQIRLLDTRDAAVWSEALKESVRQDDLDNYLTRVENDVKRILEGELDSEQITFDRYYVDEFDFF